MKWVFVIVLVVLLGLVLANRTSTFTPSPLSVLNETPDAKVDPPKTFPVPPFNIQDPSLPITSSPYAVSPNLTAYMVRYVAADRNIRDHCMRLDMAESIPSENVMSSSVNPDGTFKTRCPSNTQLPYKIWPF